MKDFFQDNVCHSCGAVDEPRFTYAGPHIKSICNHCQKYIKFINKQEIPDTQEIKLKIWALAEKNVNLINAAKKDIDFIDGLKGIDEKLQYWKLYLKVRLVLKLQNL